MVHMSHSRQVNRAPALIRRPPVFQRFPAAASENQSGVYSCSPPLSLSSIKAPATASIQDAKRQTARGQTTQLAVTPLLSRVLCSQQHSPVHTGGTMFLQTSLRTPLHSGSTSVHACRRRDHAQAQRVRSQHAGSQISRLRCVVALLAHATRPVGIKTR